MVDVSVDYKYFDRLPDELRSFLRDSPIQLSANEVYIKWYFQVVEGGKPMSEFLIYLERRLEYAVRERIKKDWGLDHPQLQSSAQASLYGSL
jgi:hypothetical protein